uniref:Uncharacterized protein n=1 Tax=Poecilia formosa TaxID=48698 RepID=A0A096LWY5_POEFO
MVSKEPNHLLTGQSNGKSTLADKLPGTMTVRSVLLNRDSPDIESRLKRRRSRTHQVRFKDLEDGSSSSGNSATGPWTDRPHTEGLLGQTSVVGAVRGDMASTIEKVAAFLARAPPHPLTPGPTRRCWAPPQSNSLTLPMTRRPSTSTSTAIQTSPCLKKPQSLSSTHARSHSIGDSVGVDGDDEHDSQDEYLSHNHVLPGSKDQSRPPSCGDKTVVERRSKVSKRRKRLSRTTSDPGKEVHFCTTPTQTESPPRSPPPTNTKLCTTEVQTEGPSSPPASKHCTTQTSSSPTKPASVTNPPPNILPILSSTPAHSAAQSPIPYYTVLSPPTPPSKTAVCSSPSFTAPQSSSYNCTSPVSISSSSLTCSTPTPNVSTILTSCEPNKQPNAVPNVRHQQPPSGPTNNAPLTNLTPCTIVTQTALSCTSISYYTSTHPGGPHTPQNAQACGTPTKAVPLYSSTFRAAPPYTPPSQASYNAQDKRGIRLPPPPPPPPPYTPRKKGTGPLSPTQADTLRQVQEILGGLMSGARCKLDPSRVTEKLLSPNGPLHDIRSLQNQLHSLEGVLETSQNTIKVLLDVIQDLEKKEAERDGRHSYRTGQDIENCGTCRDCACIIY